MSQAPPVRVGAKIHAELAELQGQMSREKGRRVSLAEVIERALAAFRAQRAEDNPTAGQQ